MSANVIINNPASQPAIVTQVGSAPIAGAWDNQNFTYVGSGSADNDKISTIVYKLGSTTVSTATFAYWTTTNNVKTITYT